MPTDSSSPASGSHGSISPIKISVHGETPVPSTPMLMVAAPASGQGKTTVTAALARLHTRAGRRVRVFKTGPDFLDPSILAAASGAAVHNIDLWMTGMDDARARLARAAAGADLILIEGVMGLHDGDPSSADVARALGLPVLCVIQANAMAQTFGALALGLARYPGFRPGAADGANAVPDAAPVGPGDMMVLANGVGSPRHARMLEDSLPADIAWGGALARDAEAALPERHLGLHGADEVPDLLARLDRLADALAALPVGQMPQGRIRAATLGPSPAADLPPLLRGRTVAVARDAAFRFIYPANIETLEALGANIAWFSPLADAGLPPCDALWLPGGYPELHAARLAANATMIAALRAAHVAGLPILAECGGMMALFDTLVDKAGTAHSMAGLLPGTVRMQKRLAALGHQAMALPEGGLRGHTFHYSSVESTLAPWIRAVSPRPDGPGEAVYRMGALTASYVHSWFPSNPAAVAALLGAASRSRSLR